MQILLVESYRIKPINEFDKINVWDKFVKSHLEKNMRGAVETICLRHDVSIEGHMLNFSKLTSGFEISRI